MATLPDALLERLNHQFGSGTTREILSAFEKVRLPSFRVNTLQTTDDAVMQQMRDDAIAFERVKAVPHAFFVKNRRDRDLLEHPLATSGKIYLQGVSSQLPPLILDPRPGERVLDMCAAPGSKTTQIAAMMQGKGTLIACEEDLVRFQKLQNTLKIQRANFVDARNTDSVLLTKTGEAPFDRILVDAPCSAEGRIDLSEPRTYRFWSQKNVVAHAKMQRRLLRAAATLLKPGGRLVYSTCTLAPEENEQMAAWLLTECPELTPFPVELPVKRAKRWADYAVTALPTVEHEGLFVAAFTRS